MAAETSALVHQVKKIFGERQARTLRDGEKVLVDGQQIKLGKIIFVCGGVYANADSPDKPRYSLYGMDRGEVVFMVADIDALRPDKKEGTLTPASHVRLERLKPNMPSYDYYAKRLREAGLN